MDQESVLKKRAEIEWLNAQTVERIIGQVVGPQKMSKHLSPAEKAVFAPLALFFGQPVHVLQLTSYPPHEPPFDWNRETCHKYASTVVYRLRNRISPDFGIYSIYGTGLYVLDNKFRKDQAKVVVPGFRPRPDWIEDGGLFKIGESDKKMITQAAVLFESRKLKVFQKNFGLRPVLTEVSYMLLNHLIRSGYQEVDTSCHGIASSIVNANKPTVFEENLSQDFDLEQSLGELNGFLSNISWMYSVRISGKQIELNLGDTQIG